MKCFNHPEREAAGVCSFSGKPFCSEELVEIQGKLYGKMYVDQVVSQLKNTGSHSTRVDVPPEIEETHFDGKIDWKVFHFSHGFLWLLILGWNFGLVSSWLSGFMFHLRITNRRIVLERGLFSKRSEDVDMYRVRDIAYSQGIIQRIFKIGTITVLSDDTSSPVLAFPCRNPRETKEWMKKSFLLERRRMTTLKVD